MFGFLKIKVCFNINIYLPKFLRLPEQICIHVDDTTLPMPTLGQDITYK